MNIIKGSYALKQCAAFWQFHHGLSCADVQNGHSSISTPPKAISLNFVITQYSCCFLLVIKRLKEIALDGVEIDECPFCTSAHRHDTTARVKLKIRDGRGTDKCHPSAWSVRRRMGPTQ